MSMEMSAWSAMSNAMHGRDRAASLLAGDRAAGDDFARPHRRRIVAFVVVGVVEAVLTVATPLLAGRVVNAIVEGSDPSVVIWLAVLIAVIAVAGTGLSLLGRFLSSSLGEGLILDLRTAVFDHVQRMPVAFFTRTRTGALVSRLNNDVIGAQRAFSDTLAGIVSNTVTLVLTGAVMLTLSWQVTVLSLLLLPAFLLPARRIGGRLAGLGRAAADHNAAMTDQTTERFSAPGATLIKLFGRPGPVESAEFASRARQRARHRRADGDGAVGVRQRADARLRARPGAGLRARRLLRAAGARSTPAPSSPSPCCSPASTRR